MFRLKFRDLFAIFINGSIMAIWGLQAANMIGQLPGDVNGALTAAFILIIQFYFRKKPKDEAV